MDRLFVIVSLFMCFGCGTRAVAPATNTDTNDKEPWFCQAGATDGQWECVQSAALAAKHEPTRLPAPRQTYPAVIDVRSQPSPPGSPTPTPTSTPNTAQLASAPLPQAEVAAERQAARSANVPKHVQLSYRPEKPLAILDLPADFWAVQLVALSSKEALEEYAKKNKVRDMSAARVWNGQKLFYVLLLGIYETRDNAQAAIASLDKSTHMPAPWIRSVASLQTAMRAADRETGSSKI